MRNILLIFIFLISNQVLVSQNIDKIVFRKTIKPEVSISVNQFLYSNSKENNSRLDSIKIIERRNLKKNIIGTWVFIDYKCSDCIKTGKSKRIKKFIVITNNKIIFYNKSISQKNIVRTESIKFTNQFDPFSDLTNLVFEDNNIWDLKVDKTREYLKIYRSGKQTENGRDRLVSGISIEYYKRKK